MRATSINASINAAFSPCNNIFMVSYVLMRRYVPGPNFLRALASLLEVDIVWIRMADKLKSAATFVVNCARFSIIAYSLFSFMVLSLRD